MDPLGERALAQNPPYRLIFLFFIAGKPLTVTLGEDVQRLGLKALPDSFASASLSSVWTE